MVFCLSVMMGFVQKAFDSTLSMSLSQAICVVGVFDLLYLLGCVLCHI